MKVENIKARRRVTALNSLHIGQTLTTQSFLTLLISPRHSLQNTPFLIYSKSFEYTGGLKDGYTYANIAATILDFYGVENKLEIGESVLDKLK